MPPLFDKHGGFRRLHSFTLATIIQIETLRFCRKFLTQNPREADVKFYDPKGRQYDQMTQAARSGRQNIIEGSERSATSKDTEMKLTDVGRASLGELGGDYEILIMDKNQVPWSVHSPEAKAINAISLDDPNFTEACRGVVISQRLITKTGCCPRICQTRPETKKKIRLLARLRRRCRRS